MKSDCQVKVVSGIERSDKIGFEYMDPGRDRVIMMAMGVEVEEGDPVVLVEIGKNGGVKVMQVNWEEGGSPQKARTLAEEEVPLVIGKTEIRSVRVPVPVVRGDRIVVIFGATTDDELEYQFAPTKIVWCQLNSHEEE